MNDKKRIIEELRKYLRLPDNIQDDEILAKTERMSIRKLIEVNIALQNLGTVFKNIFGIK